MTFRLYGKDLFGDRDTAPRASAALTRAFHWMPFTILDARNGEWIERKEQWKTVGMQSELGREHVETYNTRSFPEDLAKMAKVSIFDPVLTELMYRWFCPPRGRILDPFAGGSVRGIVAALLGYDYTGIDLNLAQVAANAAQASEIIPRESACSGAPGLVPKWYVGDAIDIDRLCECTGGDDFDFVFTCPPYFDLERYSDDPRDLSTMDWPSFLGAYREVVRKAIAQLRPDRFACYVVSEVRATEGCYRNLVGETVRAFVDAGARYYNEAILVNALGSLPYRCARAWSVSRKLGRAHQNVLVFCKGDPRAAALACQEPK